MKITIVQIDPIVGDITGNTARLLDVVKQYNFTTGLIVFPELYLTGYPPRDLLGKPGFINRTREALQEILLASKAYPDLGILFGMPLESEIGTGKGLYNSAVLVYGGEVLFKQHKSLLPFYDVFDESRYFVPASGVKTVMFKGVVWELQSVRTHGIFPRCILQNGDILPKRRKNWLSRGQKYLLISPRPLTIWLRKIYGMRYSEIMPLNIGYRLFM